MKNSNTGDHQKRGDSHIRHMWMMLIFCGVPIIGFLVIGLSGINMPSLEILILLICAIGMIGMMYMMSRDSHGKQKHHSSRQSDKGVNYETGK